MTETATAAPTQVEIALHADSHRDLALAFARARRAAGDREAGIELLAETIRRGGWNRAPLWYELVAMIEEPADYARIEQLWLDSPHNSARGLSIVRSVARAACITGHHDDGRALLRSLIVARARTARRPRQRATAVARRLAARSPWPPDRGESGFRAAAAEALRDLNAELERAGARSFLISGTLLGLVRDGDFIPWDKDIDVGVLSSEIDPARLEATFLESERLHVRRLDLVGSRVRLNHRNGVGIDVFPHYLDRDGRMWHDGAATRWWNSPFELRPATFQGVPQLVPDPPERYLDENYGDWRVPESNFDARIDAPNVEITNPGYFESLLYFSLLDAVVKAKPVKQRRYRELLRERGEGAWLERVG